MAKTGPAKKIRKARRDATTLVRESLLKQRQEILDMYEHDLRVGQETGGDGAEDLVDRANSAYNREFMLSLSSSERQILIEIEDALARVDSGDYGTCVACREKIGRKRLRAVAWAKYCIDCQELVEQGLLQEG